MVICCGWVCKIIVSEDFSSHRKSIEDSAGSLLACYRELN